MNQRQNRPHYTQEFKRDAVKLVVEQGYSANEVARRLGINQTSVSQPTTIRENKSMISVKNNQPVRVAKYVISDTHIVSGAWAVKFRSRRLGATGK